MKRINSENIFLDERLMKNITLLSVICGAFSLILTGFSNEIALLYLFDKAVKIIITILTLLSFSRFQWDAMKGMMGGLLFALLYQESFLVLGTLWGETSDFDSFLVMGVQGSLYLSAESMSFLMTIIIIINHFVINHGHIGNYGSVLFNQISIIFKILLYVFLIIINGFLNIPLVMQVNYVFEYLSDLCIIIMVICIETQLDSFKTIKNELMHEKKEKAL